MLIRGNITLNRIRNLRPDLFPVNVAEQPKPKTKVLASIGYAELLSEKERGIVIKSAAALGLNIGTIGEIEEFIIPGAGIRGCKRKKNKKTRR